MSLIGLLVRTRVDTKYVRSLHQHLIIEPPEELLAHSLVILLDFRTCAFGDGIHTLVLCEHGQVWITKVHTDLTRTFVEVRTRSIIIP